jgi:hypothetical protein
MSGIKTIMPHPPPGLPPTTNTRRTIRERARTKLIMPHPPPGLPPTTNTRRTIRERVMARTKSIIPHSPLGPPPETSTRKKMALLNLYKQMIMKANQEQKIRWTISFVE